MADRHPPKILTADEIWAAKDIEERTVDVPQWGGAVRIKTFSKEQIDAMSKTATSKDRFGKESVDPEHLQALIFIEGIVDPKLTIDDWDRLKTKSAVAVSLILKAIMDASGLSEAAITEADKSAQAGSDTALRILPGKRTEDDSRGTASKDVGA